MKSFLGLVSVKKCHTTSLDEQNVLFSVMKKKRVFKYDIVLSEINLNMLLINF